MSRAVKSRKRPVSSLDRWTTPDCFDARYVALSDNFADSVPITERTWFKLPRTEKGNIKRFFVHKRSTHKELRIVATI